LPHPPVGLSRPRRFASPSDPSTLELLEASPRSDFTALRLFRPTVPGGRSRRQRPCMGGVTLR
jgi:hypothetical protein